MHNGPHGLLEGSEEGPACIAVCMAGWKAVRRDWNSGHYGRLEWSEDGSA